MCSGKLPAIDSKLAVSHCIMHKLDDRSEKVLWQRFWLDLCTKQVVSARACANQFLPCSSSGIALIGMIIVQADSCLNSEQIDTLFISVGGQEGGLGRGGGYFGPEAQNLHVTVMDFFTKSELHVLCLYQGCSVRSSAISSGLQTHAFSRI